MKLMDLLGVMDKATPAQLAASMAFGHRPAGSTDIDETVLQAIVGVEAQGDDVLLMLDPGNLIRSVADIPRALPIIQQLQTLRVSHAGASVEGTECAVDVGDGVTLRSDLPVHQVIYAEEHALWVLMHLHT